MVIDMSRQKADQTGEKITPKHVYANPFNPTVCPILSIALHLFSISFRPENEYKNLVYIGAPYDVFTKWLSSSLEELELLGHSPKDFGTHSFRKGIATYCSGFIGGPSIIAIFLRAGWSLGQVQDRYITYSDGGDHLCGRVAAGLDFNGGSKFAVLPPHFPDCSVLSDEEWNLVAPGYRDYPPGFQSCIPYFLAQVVWHHDWIQLRLPRKHPIFTSRLFVSGLISRLKNHLIKPTTSGRCETTGMIATGVPNHIDLIRQIESLEKENVHLQTNISSFQAAIMNDLPTRLSEVLVSNFNIEGIQQMSRNEFTALLSQEFEKHRLNMTASIDTPQENQSIDDSGGAGFMSWQWGGQLNRPVPENWTMPLGKVKNICDLFITGIPTLRIRPFRLIKSRYLSRKDQSKFVKAEAVFNFIVKTAKSHNTMQNTTVLTVPIWDDIFTIIMPTIVLKISEVKHKVLERPGELSYITFYDYIRGL
jgi:hypothetical protein